MVEYPDRTIRFRPKSRLIQKEPLSPPKEASKADEFEELICALGFPDIDLPDFRRLSAAADGNLDRLLARLRQLRREGYKLSFHELVETVRQLYWIRG